MKVKIYNEKWNIRLVSEKDMEKETGVLKNDETVWGLCQPNINNILLWDEVKGVRLKAVLVHEVSHAINFITMKYYNDFDHEEVCDYIATHIDEINRIVKLVMKEVD